MAIGFAGSIGITNIVEKVLLTRYLPDHSTLIAWFAIAQVAFIIPFAIFFPIESGTPLLSVFAVVGSGALFGMGFSIVIYVVRTAEASRAYPIFNTSPIFVALVSVMVLGQHLEAVQWGAIVLTLLGAILISIDFGAGGRFRLDRSFFLLLFAALLVGTNFLASDWGLKEVNSYQGLWLQRSGAFLTLAMWVRPQTLRSVRATLRSPAAMTLILSTEFALMAVAQLALLGALEKGPVSLVAAIAATPPVWIFVLGSLASTRYLPILSETIDRRTLSIKTLAIAMTVVGTVGVVI
jgi:drug/metabolite transporter (DMT)-like permease